MKYILRSLMLIVVLCVTVALKAEQIPFAGILVEFPDSVSVRLDSANYVLQAVYSDGIFTAITFGDPMISPKVDFDEKKVMNDFDKTMLNLDGYKAVDVEYHNHIDYNQNYVRRVWQNSKKPDRKVMTYTFYTLDRPYCFVYEYTGDEIPWAFFDVVSSIKEDVSFVRKQWNYIKGLWFLSLIFFLGAMLIAQAIGWFVNRDRFETMVVCLMAIGGFFAAWYMLPEAWVLIVLLGGASAAGGKYGIFLDAESFFASILENI